MIKLFYHFVKKKFNPKGSWVLKTVILGVFLRVARGGGGPVRNIKQTADGQKEGVWGGNFGRPLLIQICSGS